MKSKYWLLYIAFIVGICSWYILPMVHYSISIIYIAPIAMLFMLNFGLRSRSFTGEIIFFFSLHIVVSIMYILVAYPLDFKQGLRIFMEQFMMFFPYYLWKITVRRNMPKEKRIILISIALMFLYVLIFTLLAFKTTPYVARILTHGTTDEYTTAFRMQNIGGFGFSYSIIFVMFFFITSMMGTSYLRNKFLYFICICIGIAYLFLAQFGLAILLAGIGIILLLIYRITDRPVRHIVLLLTLLFIFAMPSVLEFLAYMIKSELLASRFSGLATVLRGKSTTELDIIYRLQFWKNGLALFAKSPIWGNSLLDPENALVSHSSYLDLACAGGIIALSAYLTATIKYAQKILKTISNAWHRRSYRTSIFIFILMGCFNPTWQTYELGLTLFFLIPLGYEVIDGYPGYSARAFAKPLLRNTRKA
jgi:hypothetical protein